MGDREVIAVRDSEGVLRWFPVPEAKQWQASTLLGGELFRGADCWALLELMASLTGEPARLIDDEEALEWLLVNGFAPPADLSDCAATRKLTDRRRAE